MIIMQKMRSNKSKQRSMGESDKEHVNQSMGSKNGMVLELRLKWSQTHNGSMRNSIPGQGTAFAKTRGFESTQRVLKWACVIAGSEERLAANEVRNVGSLYFSFHTRTPSLFLQLY